MPGTPKEEKKTAERVQVSAYVAEERNGAYIVSYAEHRPTPAKESPAQVQTRLDGSRDGQLHGMGGKLVSESQILLGGKYPGRDIRAEIPGKQLNARTQIFIVDKRLYQLVALGTPAWVKSAGDGQILRLLCFDRKVVP